MIVRKPAILVVDADGIEHAAIAAVLREAGFAVVAACSQAETNASGQRQDFAAAVIALAAGTAGDIAALVDPGVPILILADPAALPIAVAVGGTMMIRPCEPRQVLARIVELVTAEEPEREAASPNDRQTAELAITAARLACLHRRQATATAAGLNLLAQDLARQIGQVRALQCGLAEATTAGR